MLTLSRKGIFLLFLCAMQLSQMVSASEKVADLPPPKIQIAIVMDSSNSMDGLLYQVKSRIYHLINALSIASQDKRKAVVEVALVEYGKETLSAEQHFTQVLVPLTGDIDVLSEALFTLHTNGGEEYVGSAVNMAVTGLNWSTLPTDFKMIVIAGNEGFEQGAVTPSEAISAAMSKQIIVNSIYCGDRAKGLSDGWDAVIALSGGEFLNLKQDEKIKHESSPFDSKINRLGVQVNETYIQYGTLGNQKKLSQIRQDSYAMDESPAMMTDRTLSKISSNYSAAGWDLVSLYKADAKMAVRAARTQSDAFYRMRPETISLRLQQAVAERKRIIGEIEKLKIDRSTHLEKTGASDQEDVGKTIVKTVVKQAKQRDFVFNAVLNKE
jgi:hypothetical protein